MDLKEEIRCGYTITKETKGLWSAQLELLAELKRVCDILHLRLFASGGTLLGCVRHKGYIPWDDDIDVILFREDYETLLRDGPKLFKKEFFLQSTYTDKIMRTHAQLRKNGTTCFLKGDYHAKYHRGIFIDIFIYDKVPEDDRERREFKNALMKEWKKINKPTFFYSERHSSFLVFIYNASVVLMKRLIWDFCHAFQTRVKRFARFEKMCKKYNDTDSKFVSNVSFRGVNPKTDILPFKSEWFDSPTLLEFEDYNLFGPSDVDTYLRMQYGNYTEYVVGGSFHGDLYFDTKKNYSEYDCLSRKGFLNLFNS